MPRRRRLTGIGIGTAAASLLVSVGVFGEQKASAATGDGGNPGPGSASAAAVGAYLHYGSPGVQRIQELSNWLGGAELKVGHTYLPGDRWVNIEGRPEFLQPWTQWRRGAEDRMLVLNVPMLERNEARLSDWEVRRMLRAGASGRFDHHFRTLAERLVGQGAPDTVIVLGWEMNGTTYTHRCAPDPRAWKQYWNRIVTAMRSVPGQQFRFDFAPNRGTDAIPWTECYPGDGVVDIIGMDSYDQPPGRSFDEQAHTPYGLQFQVDFARAHNKEISYPEWGLFRNGDNPEYMRRMLEWFDTHKPLYHTITDYCPHGVWQCKSNPRSAAVFREKLFGLQGPVEPAPVDPVEPEPVDPVPVEPEPVDPVPVEPEPVEPAPVEPPVNSTEWCVPLSLGDWLSQWVPQDEVCVDIPGMPGDPSWPQNPQDPQTPQTPGVPEIPEIPEVPQFPDLSWLDDENWPF
ncbi:glycoside hydrolase family 26 protein [Streptomyces sp. PR69]|uniref:glycoside hydrolase family 26 protein n=1 Tax=Streptomyces sp. PR69 TaxID=2984950 RepID=UPI002263CDB6|nr:glycosyl hydrolase [Streptomyces sp. PR69]